WLPDAPAGASGDDAGRSSVPPWCDNERAPVGCRSDVEPDASTRASGGPLPAPTQRERRCGNTRGIGPPSGAADTSEVVLVDPLGGDLHDDALALHDALVVLA